jgi:hypothetical protein
MAQVVEHTPSKQVTLSSNPSKSRKTKGDNKANVIS